MHQYLLVLLASLNLSVESFGDAAILPATFPKYRVESKEVHLNHGKLHPHEDAHEEMIEDEHLVYRYRWLGDDIVTTDEDFQGKEDDEYNEEKKVLLPGGCELTENQYMELESFKKETQYVKKCYCEQGGVYCQLNKALFKQNAIWTA